MKKEKVCNKDCFHCVHEDCICDEMDAQDYRDVRAVEEILNPKTLQQRRIDAKQREYYERNRESIAAKKREYREKNRKSIATYQRGDAIRRCRKDYGYTQMEFAMLIGVSQSSVSLYETGAVPYDPEIILRALPEFLAYMESAACGENAPQTASETITSA